MGIAWQDKRLRVFLFGDYKFQCSSYGLSGPSGARPCQHCHCLKKSMAEDPSRQPEEGKEPRTLITLADDHQRFLCDGSRVSHAKNFNVIRPILLPIPVADAVVPGLHLDLGIFAWLFERLERELNQLDIKHATRSTPVDADGRGFRLSAA